MKLYHISDNFLGDEITLAPRIPRGQSLAELHSRYRKTPRIACSDTIEKCLLGITKMKLQEVMFVYKPIGRFSIDWDSPRDACNDWNITDECWITEPTEFKFLYAIKCNTDIFIEEITYSKL